MTTVIWVILVGPVFGGRCGAEALGLGLGLPPGPAYRFALPPGLAAKTTRCLVFDQGRRPTSHLHCRDDSLTLSVNACLHPLARLFRTSSLLPQSQSKICPEHFDTRFSRTERVNDDDYFLYANTVICVIKFYIFVQKCTRCQEIAWA